MFATGETVGLAEWIIDNQHLSFKLYFLQAFIATGFNLILSFNPAHSFDPRLKQMDFEKEPGKVSEIQKYLLNS